jgi:hypothetical protein
MRGENSVVKRLRDLRRRFSCASVLLRTPGGTIYFA